MTDREFLNSVIALATATDEMKEYAKGKIAKLDEKNAKRKNTLSKVQKENIGIKEAIIEALADNGKVASELASELDVSKQKISALCRQLVTDGTITASDKKVKGKSAVKFYELATAETDGE